MSSHLLREERRQRPLFRALLVFTPPVLIAIAACAQASTPDDAESEPDRVVLPSAEAGDATAASDSGAPPCGTSHLCTVPTPLEGGSITAIVGRTKNDVWASASGGRLMHWDGDHWAQIDLDGGDTISSLFLAPDETWGVAGDLVVRATIEPKGIRTTRLENARTIRSISVLPSGDVYLGFGPSAKILAQLDFDSKSLTYLADPLLPWTNEAQSLSIRAGFFVPEEALWVVGDRGLVARYPATLLADAGDMQARAEVLPTASRALLLAAWGYGKQLWVAGSQGTILNFDGTDWHGAETGTTATLNALFGLSPNDIWAAGDDGTVLHFDGDRWASVDVGSYQGSLRAIWASASDNVWIGGEGALFHSGAAR